MTYEKSLVVIPTYNEKENILSIIPEVLAQNACFEVLVVDDGSPDGTGDLVEEFSKSEHRVHLMRRKGKLGLGSAYVAGFKWALERDYQYIFEMDADFSHSPKDLTRFLDKAAEADLVLGSRYMNRRISVVNWDLRRLILSYGANLYSRIVTGLPVSDATGGFKCFRRSALEALDFSKMFGKRKCVSLKFQSFSPIAQKANLK